MESGIFIFVHFQETEYHSVFGKILLFVTTLPQPAAPLSHRRPVLGERLVGLVLVPGHAVLFPLYRVLLETSSNY